MYTERKPSLGLTIPTGEKYHDFNNVRLGGRSWKELRKPISSKEFRITDTANDLGKNLKTLPHQENANFIAISVASLGLVGTPKIEEIYAAAESKGLEMCPAEAGPVLRTIYIDQPKGEILHIAMDPIKNILGRSDIFKLESSGGTLTLDTAWGDKGTIWNQKDMFAFKARK